MSKELDKDYTCSSSSPDDKLCEAQETLSSVALFLGELRDGLTMVSYQMHFVHKFFLFF